MGYVRHDAVIVTSWDARVIDEIKRYRDFTEDVTQRLLVGPFEGIVNSDQTFIWIPDGSKEGWGDSDRADAARERFLGFLAARNFFADYVTINFGGDDPDVLKCKRFGYVEEG